MAVFKRVLLLLLAGAVAGGVIGTLVARKFVPWYWTPGSVGQGTQQLCNMPQIVQGTIDTLVEYQLIGALVGAVVVAAVGGLAMRALAKRKQPDAV